MVLSTTNLGLSEAAEFIVVSKCPFEPFRISLRYILQPFKPFSL